MKINMKVILPTLMFLVSFSLVSYKTVPTSNHEGELNGKFSISPTEKVVFSKGNLQYCPATKQWRFADHQWEYIGKANELKSEAEFDNYRGWIDMFGFCTSGWYDGHYNINYKPSYGRKKYDEKDYEYEGYGPHRKAPHRDDPRYDWGMYNRIVNGGNITNSWRCLNEQELYYLQWQRLCNQSTGYYKSKATEFKQYNLDNPKNKVRPSEYYMGLATIAVDGKFIYGLVLLPDDWNGTPSKGYKFRSYASAKASAEGILIYMKYSDNMYSYNEWLEMERYGAVLLPAAGKVWPTDLVYDNWSNKQVEYCIMMDFSWCDRKSTEEYLPEWFNIPNLSVGTDGVMPIQSSRCQGNANRAVRLIRDVY